MATYELYKEYVIDELKKHNGLYHPVKAPIYERLITRKVKPTILHPNPEDEFSIESIGPNWTIVGDYEKAIRENIEKEQKLFEEPLMGTRLDKGGYMLLNGHHRWLASLNVSVSTLPFGLFGYRHPKVPLKVVNITVEDDIYKVVNKSNRHNCVTIDLDEVLLSNKRPTGFFSKIYKSDLRENAALLVKEMQRMGFDVWAYTGSYMSEAYIRGLFIINGCKIDGVVNGVNGKGKSVKLRDIFRSKYKNIVHVDNDTITVVDTATKNYDIIDINADNDGWAAGVVNKISKIIK